ncbi:MAG: ParB/RepB/Spo0J family partition protein [Bacillota bacterium]|nr:ParB/RepB/Spo0J family partition protein [Bacillota bacterium]MDI7248964.1 ParB/RepB/Spo0J family partition protein [Bacillota bacterium]
MSTSARRGLGKGLGALLPQEGLVQDIALEQVRPAPGQPRQRVDEEGLAELAQSVRAHGVLQPVLVRPVAGGYELVAGERRWRAAQLAGLKTIPAVVKEVDEAERLELALVENLQREDLNPMEEAAGFRQLLEKFGYTQEQLAARVGKSRSYVANTLRLLALAEEVQEMVRAGRLSAGHARALLALPDRSAQVAVAQVLVQRGASVREAEEMVRRQLQGGARERRPKEDEKWAPWEDRLRRVLGTKVSIRGGEERGRIEIQYYSRADLERLLELLGAGGRGRA